MIRNESTILSFQHHPRPGANQDSFFQNYFLSKLFFYQLNFYHFRDRASPCIDADHEMAAAPPNYPFSTGFIRCSDQADTHAANSENTNGFLVILEYILRICVQKIKNSSGFIRFPHGLFRVLRIAIFRMVFHVLRKLQNDIAQQWKS